MKFGGIDSIEKLGAAVNSAKEVETEILLPAGWPKDALKKLAEKAACVLLWQNATKPAAKASAPNTG